MKFFLLGLILICAGCVTVQEDRTRHVQIHKPTSEIISKGPVKIHKPIIIKPKIIKPQIKTYDKAKNN